MNGRTKLGIESINDIEGRLQPDECLKLYILSKQAKGNILEIGSLYGKSSVCLALGLNEPHKVYTIDPHFEGSLDEFLQNIKKANLEQRIVPFVMTSQEAFENCGMGNDVFSLIWIDGCHDYEWVKYDFEHWVTRLESDGIVAFHDFVASHPGVVRTIFESTDKIKLLGFRRNIVYFSKGRTGIIGKIKLFLYLLKEPKQIFSQVFVSAKEAFA